VHWLQGQSVCIYTHLSTELISETTALPILILSLFKRMSVTDGAVCSNRARGLFNKKIGG